MPTSGQGRSFQAYSVHQVARTATGVISYFLQWQRAVSCANPH